MLPRSLVSTTRKEPSSHLRKRQETHTHTHANLISTHLEIHTRQKTLRLANQTDSTGCSGRMEALVSSRIIPKLP